MTSGTCNWPIAVASQLNPKAFKLRTPAQPTSQKKENNNTGKTTTTSTHTKQRDNKTTTHTTETPQIRQTAATGKQAR